MARTPTANDRTLFHLVPHNHAAQEVLSHPDNRRFVSLSSANEPGLEIGFHVPAISRGHVITRLGRNTDLILRDSYSGVHVAFEMHPETLVVMLSVRTKWVSSVSISSTERTLDEPDISGDCALVYGQEYNIGIASYQFKLIWRSVEGPDWIRSLKDMATKGYEDAMQRLKDVRSRDLSIPESSSANSWYMTRLQSAKRPLFTELEGSRVLIGEGGFGKVYKTVDKASGNYFAVKVVDLTTRQGVDAEASRVALHREIKIMERVSHVHIIELLGTKDFDSDQPLIFMPLRQGSLHSLVNGAKASDSICRQGCQTLNILYQDLGQGQYLFQLADFGFAKDFRNAKTFCGTIMYLAPELYSNQPQTPKMDIWSLFVTMAEITEGYTFPPKAVVTSPRDIIQAVQEAAAGGYSELKPMARMNPALRASAAQMLLTYFDGNGLTTPRNQIPPIEPDDPQPAAMPPPYAPAAPRPAGPPVIEYPRRQRQQRLRPVAPPGTLPNRILERPVAQPVRAHRDGITKAPQPMPQQRLLQVTRAMQAKAEEIRARARDGRPREKELLAMPAAGEAGPARNVLVQAQVAEPSEIARPRVPGAFPE